MFPSSPKGISRLSSSPKWYIGNIIKWRNSMSFYNHKEIEPKWQILGWQSTLLKQEQMPQEPRFYALDIHLPIWAGLHVGHPEGYSNWYPQSFKRANLQCPFNGWILVLPAEQYAMDTRYYGRSENIAASKRQINAADSLTTGTVKSILVKLLQVVQWIFTKLYENGFGL